MADILALVLLVLILFPKLAGRWWSNVERWKRYYDHEGMDTAERQSLIRTRAKNIRRIRNERFSRASR
jgi:hypothetical protein